MSTLLDRPGVARVCPSCDREFVDYSRTAPRTYCEDCGPPSKRQAPVVVQPARVPGRPFTLRHFRAWAKRLRLPGEKAFALDEWEAVFVDDLFRGRAGGWLREAWLIVPEGNGKSTLVATLVLYCVEFSEEARIPVAASARDQANIIFEQGRGFVRRDPAMSSRFDCKPGLREIVSGDGSLAKIFASDAGTGDGIIPYPIEVIDELHRHRDLELYRTWAGKLDKQDATLVVISTAGEPGSEFEDVRNAMRLTAVESEVRGCFGRYVGATSILHEYAVPEGGDVDDLKLVKAANPSSRVTVETLRAKRARPSWKLEHWRRLTCNQPTKTEGQAITPGEWDRLADPGVVADKGSWSVGWMDLGWKIDTSAVGVVVWEGMRRRVVPAPQVIVPPVDEAQVVAAILTFELEYRPVGWVFDPNAGGQQMAQLLEKGEHPLQVELGVGPLTLIEHSQDNAPMSLGATRLDEAIRNGYLVHTGDGVLRTHALNAVAKSLGGEKWKYDRPSNATGERRGRYPIDALTGLVMGHSVAFAENALEAEFALEVV